MAKAIVAYMEKDMKRTVDIRLDGGRWFVNNLRVSESVAELIYDLEIKDIAIGHDFVVIGDMFVCRTCGYMGTTVEHDCGEKQYLRFWEYVAIHSTPTVKLTYDGVYTANGNIIDQATMDQLVGFDIHERWLALVVVSDGDKNVCRACGMVYIGNHIC